MTPPENSKLRELGARLYAAGHDPSTIDLEALLERAKGDVDLAADLQPQPPQPPEPKRRKREPPTEREVAAYVEAQPSAVRDELMRLRWLELITHPSVGVIAGRKRRGKSAAAYWLQQELTRKYEINPYAVGLPSAKWHLIEGHVRPLGIDEIASLPDHSVVLIDEAAISLYARKWQGNDFSDALQQIIALAGQRHQTIIFVCHSLRKFDVTALVDIDWLVFKEPSQFHMRLERTEFRELSEAAYERFAAIPSLEERLRTAIVIADDAKDPLVRRNGRIVHGERVTNPLPSFWSQELSEAYAGLTLAGDSAPQTAPQAPTPGLSKWFSER